MALVDPYKLKRPAPRVETKTFTDPDYPGLEWTLTVRALAEAPFQLSVQSRAEELIANFILPEDAAREKFAPRDKVQPVEDEDGNLRDIALDEDTCRRIAAIQCTEVPDAGAEPLSVDTLAEYAVKYNILFLQASSWVFGLLNASRKKPEAKATDGTAAAGVDDAPKAIGEPDTDAPFGAATGATSG